MKILVVGRGAREHALVAKIAESPLVESLYAAPGNAGMEEVRLARGGTLKCVRISSDDVSGLRLFAKSVNVDLTIVGPEVPLSLGIVDTFLDWGLAIVGPTRAAARLETSKIFAKRFMWERGIPTVRGSVAFNVHAALEYIHDHFRMYNTSLVVKADGLARGRGVFICRSEEQAAHTACALMEEGVLGDAGRAIVLEHFLIGEEISVHILTNGTDWWLLPVAQDYKRLTAKPESPMTGGMGAISPVPRVWSVGLAQKISRSVIEPTLSGMRTLGMPYRGVLYVGLMIVEEKSPEPYILEYNARFGDPEAQVVLSRVRNDIVPYFCRIAARPDDETYPLLPIDEATSQPVEFSSRRRVCVVLASEGYPDAAEYHRYPIEGLEAAAALPHTHIYHAGTIRGGDGRFYTFGGRVASVVGEGDTIEDARERAYTAVDKIHWTGMQCRRDIGC